MIFLCQAVLSDRFTVYLRKIIFRNLDAAFCRTNPFPGYPALHLPDTVNKPSQQHHIHTEIQPQHHKNDRRHTSVQTGKSFEDCQIH